MNEPTWAELGFTLTANKLDDGNGITMDLHEEHIAIYWTEAGITFSTQLATEAKAKRWVKSYRELLAKDPRATQTHWDQIPPAPEWSDYDPTAARIPSFVPVPVDTEELLRRLRLDAGRMGLKVKIELLEETE